MTSRKITKVSRKSSNKIQARRKTQASRKSASKSTRSTSKKCSTTSDAFIAKGMPDGRSLLLELPTELRDEIYEMVAEDAGAILRKTGKLASRSSLTRVSRQVHEEYQSVLMVSCATLTTHVKDFDFSHLVRFLNKLSDREFRSLPTLNQNQPAQRECRVLLQISPDECPENPEKLHSWLVRCEHPTKKGTSLNIVYAADLLGGPTLQEKLYTTNTYNWDLVWATGLARSLRQAGRVQDKLAQLKDQVEPGRLLDELTKIHGALVALCWAKRGVV